MHAVIVIPEIVQNVGCDPLERPPVEQPTLRGVRRIGRQRDEQMVRLSTRVAQRENLGLELTRSMNCDFTLDNLSGDDREAFSGCTAHLYIVAQRARKRHVQGGFAQQRESVHRQDVDAPLGRSDVGLEGLTQIRREHVAADVGKRGRPDVDRIHRFL